MWTISRLAKRFGISRSTLLYYDSIGLLSPSHRTAAAYRVYDDKDLARMERIDLYRRTGLPLARIRSILDSRSDSAMRDALELRLREINTEVEDLRMQQRVTLDLLGRVGAGPGVRGLDKEGWVAILRASGMNDDDMERWHVEFERLAPAAHEDFLESLGIAPAEIAHIRAWSRDDGIANAGERSAGPGKPARPARRRSKR